jgi:hypothetical protein
MRLKSRELGILQIPASARQVLGGGCEIKYAIHLISSLGRAVQGFERRNA